MHLLIRVDAGASIGIGHVMRCLALAQAWQDLGGRVYFALASSPVTLTSWLASEGMIVDRLTTEAGSDDDAVQTVRIARDIGAQCIVVDGYQFDAAYQRIIKNARIALLIIDDLGQAAYYEADLVVNQNLYATEELYRRRSRDTRLLLGTRYALLRREFWLWRCWQRVTPTRGRRLLVTLGGSDPDNSSLKVVQALKLMQDSEIEARIIVGPASEHREQLYKALVRDLSNVMLLTEVKDMPMQMAWADLAVTAAGSTCWELAFFGVPMITVVLAQNQEPVAASLSGHGVAINVGWHHTLDNNTLALKISYLISEPTVRRQFSEHGRELVDGYGAQRVVTSLLANTV